MSAHPGASLHRGRLADLRNAAATFNLEVIDPANWTYLALKTVPVDQTVAPSWRQHTVSWTAHRSDVVLRLTVAKAFNHPFAPRAELDDVVVQCAYQIVLAQRKRRATFIERGQEFLGADRLGFVPARPGKTPPRSACRAINDSTDPDTYQLSGAWDSNPRGTSPPLAVFKTAAIVH